MDTKDLEKFDPTVAELTKLVEATKDIKATDLEDTKQLEIVRKNRIGLKNARVQIEKTGKSLREDALKFQKAVIAKEKELIGIIEPEEDRLAAIEEEAKLLTIRKERLQKLPVQKERITTAGLDSFASKTEEELLELDVNGFEAYFNELTASKIQYDQDQAEIERKKAEELLQQEREVEEKKRIEEDKKRDEDNARIKAEQDKKAAELVAKEKQLEDERIKIEHEKELKLREEQTRIETENRLKKESEDKALAEKQAFEKAEQDKKAEQATLEKKTAYIAFLKSHGYTKETSNDFKTEETLEGYILFKKVGIFNK